METKGNIEKINKTKGWFFDKINTIYKSLSRFIMRKRNTDWSPGLNIRFKMFVGESLLWKRVYGLASLADASTLTLQISLEIMLGI